MDRSRQNHPVSSTDGSGRGKQRPYISEDALNAPNQIPDGIPVPKNR